MSKRQAWHNPETGDLPRTGISVVALCWSVIPMEWRIQRMMIDDVGWCKAETRKTTSDIVFGWMTDQEAINAIGINESFRRFEETHK